jgi:hypothetical protein
MSDPSRAATIFVQACLIGFTILFLAAAIVITIGDRAERAERERRR